MIPILYEGNETTFRTNGLGRLADAISCRVVEERNATYELEMTYPISGVHYEDLAENRIILAQPFDGGLTQPFIIYKITRPLNGTVTVNAEHISYRLSGFTVMPFSANSCVSALAGISTYSAVENPFTLTTDKATTGNFSVTVPANARELLCGSQGSILDVYGKGDYEFNRFEVKLWQNRGADNHVTLRYGKNITDLKSELDMTGVYTGIAPYWSDGSGNLVTLTEKVVLSDYANLFPYKIIKPVDFSERWDNAPTEEQLRTAAQAYITNNEGWKLKNNLTVSFVALWNTEEYKNIAPLERVKMCDVVRVLYTKLGVDFSTRVIRTDYDVLQERYNEITLGDTYYTLSQVFNDEIEQGLQEQTTHMQKAIAHATALITGGLGGHVVMNLNADGEPQEILIMDTDDISTAVNVLRMNMNGIGFSQNGYNGPFSTAWTIDSHFYADYIDTGNLNADLLQVGRIQPIVSGVASANYWDMLTGDFHLSSSVQVGNSTIASKGDITTYDSNLNQQAVFNKLTNNGSAQGITLANGNLYINASYIKSGALEVGGNNMIGSITLMDGNSKILGVWNSAGMKMYNGTNTTARNQDLTGSWTKDGIDVKKGSIKGASLTVGGDDNLDGYIVVNNDSGTEIGRWDNDGLVVKSGTITGATIQTAFTGPRIEMNSSYSIEGKNDTQTWNLINMMQSGSTQMTIDALTQLNIRTEKLGVLNEGKGTASATVNLTLTDSWDDYSKQEYDTGRNCWRINDVRKYMPADPQTGAGQAYEMHEIYLHDEGREGNWQVYCTLPVFLKFRYKNERRMLGMVLSNRTADSIVV